MYTLKPMSAKQESDEFTKVMRRARTYHEEQGGVTEKKSRLQELADELGVEISFVEPKEQTPMFEEIRELA